MMTAFNDFSAAYDWMFPWATRLSNEGTFFQDLFAAHGVRRVLDCACGTGMHPIQFARLGLQAYGSDLSPAMIAQAESNARQSGLKIHLRVGSFTELTAHFPPRERFDAVICVGNSLTLAPADSDVERAIRQMAGVLKPGGLCVLNLFNWDRLADEGLRIMPATARIVDGEEVTFLRVFHHRGEVIRLHIVIISRRGELVDTRILTAYQRPVGPARLLEWVRSAGFESIALYGGYDRRPFAPESSDQLVLVAGLGSRRKAARRDSKTGSEARGGPRSDALSGLRPAAARRTPIRKD